ncbi:MAG TPA: hypothetical protein VMC05_13965, partial [Xanthobacteraceae bacterium]|nr:hypothetical protein [Xanthobacteraceae bacterium]
TVSIRPSTLWIVARMRTGGGCCASAIDAANRNVAAKAAAMIVLNAGIVILSACLIYFKR